MKRSKALEALAGYAHQIMEYKMRFKVPEAPALWKSMKFKTEFDGITDSRILEFRFKMLANRGMQPEPVKINEPASTWQFWKEKNAPAWFLNRWPVVYRTTHAVPNVTVRICPHATLDWKELASEHIKFMQLPKAKEKSHA